MLNNRTRFEVDSLLIDPSSREIQRDGEAVKVEPLVFDLIIYLVEHSDRVVSKEELVDKVWRGRVISDATLSSCVKTARRVLGDSGRTQHIIKTFQRRGFRFIGPLRKIDVTESISSPRQNQPAALDDGNPADTDDIDLTLPIRPSIAVLPFSTLDPHEGQRLLANGLVHDLTVRLARTRWLFVTARASAERFHLQSCGAVAIGQSLGVRYLLHGSVIRSVDRLRLIITLTDAELDSEIWAQSFDRKIDDLFAVQDEICDHIVVAVESEIQLKERQKAMLRPLATLDAWTAYHQANDYLYRFSPNAHDQAESLFQIAARADPGSSQVFAGLSFLYWQRAFFETTPDRQADIARAIEYAQHSVSLDHYDPQAHWVLGRTALLSSELDLAVDELSAAVDLNPSFAKGHFSLGYGKLFREMSTDVIDSAAAARRLSPYDPMSFAYLSLFAEAYSFVDQHADAMVYAKKAARQRNAHHHIKTIAAWCHEVAGHHEAALGFAAQVRQHKPDYSRAEFFRAYPYVDRQRSLIDRALQRLGF